MNYLRFFVLQAIRVLPPVFCSLPSFGQEMLEDSLLLKEVVVLGIDAEKYMPGGKLETFRTDSLPVQSLTQSLQQFPVYFIEYGAAGQLASINLRGLGASRTSLLWNGIEINSFTLGQSDFNLIPAKATDEISMQWGSGASLFGNGALGGSVNLRSRPQFEEGQTITFQQGIASFGNYQTQVGHGWSGQRWNLKTKAYYQSAENNFPYALGDSTVRQRNAAYLNYGLVQDVYFRPSQRHLFSLNFWYNYNDREVQPNRNDLTNDDKLVDDNFRVLGSWLYSGRNTTGELSLGFTRDDQLFNGNRVLTSRWFGACQLEWRPVDRLFFKGGLNLNHLRPNVDAYDHGVTETRNDLFASGVWQPSTRITVGVNLRQPIVEGSLKPFSPSVSGEWVIMEMERAELKGQAQVSRSFRLPTLNDRYWFPGGNLDLRSELSWNQEVGLKFAADGKRMAYEGNLNYFRHDVDDWIIWLPGGRGVDDEGQPISFWFPDNVRQVLAQGFELQSIWTFQPENDDFHWRLKSNVSYTRSQNKSSFRANDRSLNKQLPYTPLWMANAQLQGQIRNWRITVTGIYTGKRYRDASNELSPLPAYTLAHVNLSRQIRWGSFEYLLSAALNNVFNERYESFENRAMPGRNYAFNFQFNYKF